MSEKNVKIIIGANYGDESKGLVTRNFVKTSEKPIVIFHNGTAQRAHTVDYNPKFRHIYRHFGCGTADGAPTFYAKTFWVHPMEFHREFNEITNMGITPFCYCDPMAPVITPFDMLVDHTTEAWIAFQHGEREYGSCGYGSWCAIEDRGYDRVYKISDYIKNLYDIELYHIKFLLENTWRDCMAVLAKRGVNIEQLPAFKKYFISPERKETTIRHFIDDIIFFYQHVTFMPFNDIYNNYNDIIFENAQGLGLDINCGSEWHTTSNTGLTNPVEMLKDKEDFNAEVCYVTRAYITRHGIGPMGNEAYKKDINADMVDKTNVPNEFQGSLRYGYPEDNEQKIRIWKDWSIVQNDSKYTKTLAITHCNEFPETLPVADYISYNPYSVIKC